MTVNAGFEAEYEQRHNPVWPELAAALKEHGVRSYSIFLHAETRQLFACVELEDEARWQALAQTPICRRWWAHMKSIMPANTDDSPVSIELREVFHLGKS